MKTQTETKNFKPVTVSTVIVNNKVETMIFFNGCEIWSTNKVQDVKKQHHLSIRVAENYTLENCGVEPMFYKK